MRKIDEIINTVKDILKNDPRVKSYHEFQAGRALQIRLHDGDVFNILIVKESYKTKIKIE